MSNETIQPDGTFSFEGGQNAAFDPASIPENAYELGINISCKKGIVNPRWGWEQLDFDWSKAGEYTRKTLQKVTFKTIFEEGRFQARFPYSSGGIKYIAFIISGIIFLINKKNYLVTVLNPTDPLYIQHIRINVSTAGRFFVIFDFPNYPMILDGVTARRADPKKEEVPISQIGAYNQNRLFISNAGIDLTAGDPTGSRSAPDAPITFKEIMQNSSPFVGDSYQLPTDTVDDNITAMGFLQVIDTSTGIGPLLVSSPAAIYSFNTQNPRASWLTGNFGSVILSSAGISGQRAQVNVNSDLIFESPDGQVRALSMARNDAKRWGNSPISNEVQNVLINRDLELTKYAALSYHKNKVFVTANPYRVLCKDLEGITRTDIAHGGFAVLELDNTSTISGQSTPTWAGLWTGVRPMDMVEVAGDAFVISKDPAGINVVYKVRPDITWDIRKGKEVNFRSRIYTREFAWKNATQKKLIRNLKLYMKGIQDKLYIDAWYKPAHGSKYAHWKDYNFDAPYRQCKIPINALGYAPQSIRDLFLGGVADDLCEGTARELYNIVRGVQVRLDIVGRAWKLVGIEINGTLMSDQDVLLVDCTEAKPVPVVLDCNNDWDLGIEEILPCQQ